MHPRRARPRAASDAPNIGNIDNDHHNIRVYMIYDTILLIVHLVVYALKILFHLFVPPRHTPVVSIQRA